MRRDLANVQPKEYGHCAVRLVAFLVLVGNEDLENGLEDAR